MTALVQNVKTTFYDHNLQIVCSKLERLSFAGLYSLVYFLWVRQGAYTRGEHLKGASLTLHANIRLGWKCLPGINT
jgi:hypothetical protein